MYISKENRKEYGEIASLYEKFYDKYNKADSNTRNLARAAAIYQRDIFPTLTIILTVSITFIGFILAYYGAQMVQQKIAAALFGFLIAIDLLMYIGWKRKHALVCLVVLEDIEKVRKNRYM